MSRHHMLPPIIFTPPPNLKKVEPKKRRLSLSQLDESDEAAETGEMTATNAAAPAGLTLPSSQMAEIEDSVSKPQGPVGRLSQDTMMVLLRAQELN